jgi:hypothetical protein
VVVKRPIGVHHQRPTQGVLDLDVPGGQPASGDFGGIMMKDEHFCDFVRTVLRETPVDKRFRLSGPIIDPDDTDMVRFFLDFHGGDVPHSTIAVPVRKSKLRGMGGPESVEYIREKYLKAEAELVEFIS